MAIELAELEGLRDALVRARAAGVRSVAYEGRRVDYGSDQEMAAALADLEARIATAKGGGQPRPVAGVAVFRRN